MVIKISGGHQTAPQIYPKSKQNSNVIAGRAFTAAALATLWGTTITVSNTDSTNGKGRNGNYSAK